MLVKPDRTAGLTASLVPRVPYLRGAREQAPMQMHEEPSRGATAAEISNAVVQILHEYTGRGPTKAKTEIGANVVSVLLADTLTRPEQRLVDDGKERVVLAVRREYQETMRERLTGAVQDITGRKVVAFMSQNHIDPDLAIENFVLED
jgi:uncharacterized protein YbcI